MLAYLLLLVAVLSRVLPHPWLNFTAVGGALLFFGARRPLLQSIWPVAALVATDYYLTTYVYNYPFHVTSYLPTWMWYAAAIVLGRILLHNHVTWKNAAGAVLLSSTSFFLISNFATWADTALYPHTFAGLTECYIAAIPFYRNDLLSTTIVTALAFGVPALIHSQWGAHESKLSA